MPVSIEHRYLQRQRAELERERPKEGEAPWKGDVGGHPARNTGLLVIRGAQWPVGQLLGETDA